MKASMLDIVAAVEQATLPLLDNEDESARMSFSRPVHSTGSCWRPAMHH